MTSGSAGAAAAAAAAASAGAGSSSTRSVTTWTIIISASLVAFHFDPSVVQVADAHALVQHQLADVDRDVLRDVARQTLDLDLAVDEVDDAALLLDALGLALEHDRNRDGDRLVHRDLVEVGVEQLVVDRIDLVLLDEHRVSPPSSFSPMRVFTPDSEWRMRSRVFGSTAISTALPFSAP